MESVLVGIWCLAFVSLCSLALYIGIEAYDKNGSDGFESVAYAAIFAAITFVEIVIGLTIKALW